jgi:hypothetical protein
VVLLRPAHPSATAAEAIVRLRGELLAAGYTVELADVPEHGSVRAAMEPPDRPGGADAVVALFGDEPQGAGSLWVVDWTTGRTVSRSIPHDGEGTRAAQILAVRALELLRASFLEAALRPPQAGQRASRVASPPPAAGSPPAASSLVSGVGAPDQSRSASESSGEVGRESASPPALETNRPEPGDGSPAPAAISARRQAAATAGLAPPAAASGFPPSRLALEVGGLALGSLEGIPPAVLPLFRATLAPFPRRPLGARLTVAGLGTRPRVSGAQGAAEVSHQLALVEALWTFRPGRGWQPFLSLGGGAAYVSAQGLPVTGGGAGRTAAAWAFAGDAGAGLHARLSARVQLGGEVHVEVDAPNPVIRFLGSQLAAEGRPTLLATLSLLAWL